MPGICGNDGLRREVRSPFLKDSCSSSPHRLTAAGPDATFFRARGRSFREPWIDLPKIFLPPLLSGQTEHTIGLETAQKSARWVAKADLA
jgi:hypothetical protein